MWCFYFFHFRTENMFEILSLSSWDRKSLGLALTATHGFPVKFYCICKNWDSCVDVNGIWDLLV